ncbi:MAG TPA: DUF4097 family beta strand repeat-containing protein [Micromonospora sp.]
MTSWTVDAPQRLSFDQPVDRLDAYLVAGRLSVVGTDGPARVEVTRASRTPVVVEQRDGRLSVRHDRIPKWPGLLWWLGQLGRRFTVEINIAVPSHAQADLQMVDGSVVVSGLRQDTRVDVTSGQVTLLGLGGRTSARLVSGPVEALEVDGDLNMETISGELILANSAAERVRATTVSGSITCDLDNPRGSEIRLGTTSGSVAVRIRQDSDLAVHLQTTSGRITSAFPELRAGAGPAWAKESRGVLGAGEGQLWATSTSGNISLLARPAEDDEDVEELP